jgi:hypothetical protein
MCPVTNTKLDPSQIRKPSRIILNILGGLMIKCTNRAEGCLWTGKYESIDTHVKTCAFRPREQLCEMLDKKTNELEGVKRKYAELKVRCKLLQEENMALNSANESLQRQVKVYDAFVKNHHDEYDEEEVAETEASLRASSSSRKGKATGVSTGRSDRESDLQVINRLRLLEDRIDSKTKGL